ncbi:MAG: hypothetical protein RLP14_01545 [Owenweeksia sp.]
MKYLSLTYYTLLIMLSCPVIYGQCPEGDTATLLAPFTTLEVDTVPPVDLTYFYKTKTGEDRIIYWIHGLGGNLSSWNPVSTVTQDQVTGPVTNYSPRRVLSLKPEYVQTSMNDAINDLQSQLVDENVAHNTSYTVRDDNFLIAHSQGGIVSRGTDYLEDTDPFASREFGGLVTFGSPHQGAAILNNGLQISNGGSGKLLDFATEACIRLSKPLIEEGLTKNNYLVVVLLASFKIDQKIVNLGATACNFFGGSLLPIVMSDYQLPIVQDYKAGASFINNTLNTYNTTLPMLAFYGEEEKPEFWRVMNSLVESPTLQPPFTADDDSTHIDYKKLRADYYNKHLTFKNDRENLEDLLGLPCNTWQWVFSPWLCIGFDFLWYQANDRTRAYQKGVEWIDQANDKWRVIIGARRTEVTGITHECNCADKCNGGANLYPIVNSEQDCIEIDLDPCMLCSYYKRIHTGVVNKANDGIVTAESAKNLPGAITFGDDRLKMDKTNHQQMRNNGELREKLNGLFSGDYGNYFYTKNK